MKSKEKLIQEIVEELKNIHEDYVEKVYEIIHTLGVKVATQKAEQKSDEEIWEQMIDEINRVREQYQKVMHDKTGRLFT